MERTAVYIRSYELSPSGYYRIMQYAKKLPGKFVLHNVLPACFYKLYLRSKNYKWLRYILNPLTFFLIFFRTLYFLLSDSFAPTKTVIISRGVVPRCFPFFIKLAYNRLLSKSRLVWDFDDDILHSGEISKKEFDYLSRKSEHIVVTHSYLSALISPRYANKIIILPTTDGDFQHFNHAALLKKRMLLFESEIRLAWVGTAVNLPFVESAIAALDGAATLFFEKTGKRVVLTIVSSRPLAYTSKSIVINNITWSRERAIAELNSSHIGIMPLKETAYSLGKGGFKLIQYLATGLPVIGSDVGFNKDIIKNDFGRLISSIDDTNQWYEAIYSLAEASAIYEAKSVAAIATWNRDYPYDKGLAVWKEILCQEEHISKIG